MKPVKEVLHFFTRGIILALIVMMMLAVLLDQKIRAEGVLRTIYLYPMAISFIVTGTAWKCTSGR